jgi:hypothetical protein
MSKGSTIPELSGGVYHDPTRRTTILDRVRQLFRRGEFVAFLQVLAVVLLIYGADALERYQTERDRRIRAGRSDLVYELDDEEFRRLTEEDSPPPAHGGNSYEDPDAYFFGTEDGQGPTPAEDSDADDTAATSPEEEAAA